MSVTAKRDNLRLVAIVLGEAVSKVRNEETTALLDYGFNLYKSTLIHKKTDVIDTIELNKSSVSKVNVYPKEDVTIISKKSEVSVEYTKEVSLDKDIKLPLNKGDAVGKLIIKYKDKTLKEIELIVDTDVEKQGFISYFFKTFGDLLKGDVI